MRSPEAKATRPLSPHLQIYKPQLTSILSILHRITGVGLSFGIVLLAVWLACLADGPEAYATFASYAQTILGQLVLIGLTAAFFYHLCNGIRHLMWDAGMALELPEVYKTGRIVIAATIVLTAVVWLKVYGVGL